MRIIIHLLTLLAISGVYGQITTTKVRKPLSELANSKSAKYDSLRNYLGIDVAQYVGQQFYLRPRPEILRQYGYENFYTTPNDENTLNHQNVYKCCQSNNSIYDELAGKYFNVIEVIRHPNADDDDLKYGSIYFIKLKEKKSGAICFYRYNSKHMDETFEFPITVVGYFEKCKKRYIGKKYQTKGLNWLSEKNPMIDIETGKEVSIAIEKIWKCVNVTIEDKYFELSLILQSSTGEKVAIPINNLKSDHFVIEK